MGKIVSDCIRENCFNYWITYLILFIYREITDMKKEDNSTTYM